MKYDAIPSNNSSVTEKHAVEDDILFTNPLAGKGLTDMSTLSMLCYLRKLGISSKVVECENLTNGIWKEKVDFIWNCRPLDKNKTI